MAEVQATGNGSSEKQSTEGNKSCTLLRPSAFTPSSHPPSQTAQVSDCGPTGHFGNNPFASAKMPLAGQTTEGAASQPQRENENSTSNRFTLRPSLLDKHTSNLFKDSNFGTPVKSNSFKLEPPKLFSPLTLTASQNKFSDVTHETKLDVSRDETEQTDENKATPEKEETKSGNDTDEPAVFKRPETPTGDEDDQKSGAISSFIFGEMMETRVTAATTPASTSNSEEKSSDGMSSGGFIFGSNLANRVIVPEANKEEKDGNSSETTTGSDGLQLQNEGAESGESVLSLEESAAKRLAQSEEGRPEFKPVEVITGEENESNVFQFNTKLYVFNKPSQSWVERGRGLLRLNDMTDDDGDRPFQSRLVMRTHGSLRVILNTMIWPGMVVERASTKSIKITAVDGDDGIKIFLISANPNDAEQIFNAISSRLQQLKTMESNKLPAREQLSDESPPKKRHLDVENTMESKRQRLDQDQRREQTGDESNDSSALYPETEASNEEGFASSPTIQSSSSSSDA